MRIHLVFHNSLLKPYIETLAHSPNFTRPPPEIVGGEEGHYEIEKILQSRPTRNRRSTEYLVHWKGYTDANWTWVPAKELSHAKELVQEFLSRQKPKEGIRTLQAQWEPKEGILSRTQSVTTRKQGNPKQSPPKAAPKPSYSHVVRTTLRPCDPGKVSPDLSCVTSHDTSTLLVSRDPKTCDPGNEPPDLPRDWSVTWSHVTTQSPDQTRFKHAPSPLIGTWKTVGMINGLLSNQRSHKTLVRSTEAHLSTVFVPALKYGPPV